MNQIEIATEPASTDALQPGARTRILANAATSYENS
jgi:hypothetical protein